MIDAWPFYAVAERIFLDRNRQYPEGALARIIMGRARAAGTKVSESGRAHPAVRSFHERDMGGIGLRMIRSPVRLSETGRGRTAEWTRIGP